MSGRYVLKTPAAKVAEIFRAKLSQNFKPHYNIAPGSRIPVVRFDAHKNTRSLDLLHWGLVPSWSKDSLFHHKNVNARAETLGELAAFKSAYRRRRCLIPVDGFYEWDRSITPPLPYFIQMGKGETFALAGLWESWKILPGQGKDGVKGEGEFLETCVMVTVPANKFMAKIHDRMPVIVDPGQYDLWLDPEFQERATFRTLLKPFRGDRMSAWPVSRKVNEEGINKPSCLTRVKAVSAF